MFHWTRLIFLVACFWIGSRPLIAFFEAESVAIQFNLPTLAEKSLRHHVLDVYPAGSECRLLLAKVAMLKQEYGEMRRQLNLSEIQPHNRYLHVLADLNEGKTVRLTPLLLARQQGFLGQFLSAYNAIVLEPVGSFRWAQFWYRYATVLSSKNYAVLYHIGLELKFSFEGVFTSFEVNDATWQHVTAYLFHRRQYALLEDFLDKFLKETKRHQEQFQGLLWLLKTKRALGKDLEDIVLNYIRYGNNTVEELDAIFSEWRLSVPEAQKRAKGLKQFEKIYKKKNSYFHVQYLQLLQASCLLESGELSKAKKILDKNFSKLDAQLQVLCYELLAKHALLQEHPQYRLAADYFSEAKQRAPSIDKMVTYARLQAECYCLDKDYNRAFYTYQGIMAKAKRVQQGNEVAYEWVLAGILCQELAQELQNQFDLCRSLDLLTIDQEQQLRLIFAQSLFMNKDYDAVVDFCEKCVWTSERYREAAQLIIGKCQFLLGDFEASSVAFLGIKPAVLEYKDLADYYLWGSYLWSTLNQSEKAFNWLKQFEALSQWTSKEALIEARLLQAKLLAKQHATSKAKQVLLEVASPEDAWWPFLMFQAGCYAEQGDLNEQQNAIQIFQKLYETAPRHPLAIDARMKQGVLLLNLNQMDLAIAVFNDLLPHIQGITHLWCRYLLQKCYILSKRQPLKLSRAQLNLLLKEQMPLELKLEITLQLALVFKDEGDTNGLQKLLWETCYPLLMHDEKETFSENELYWLTRCLLILAQNMKDKTAVRQIYSLMVEAQLPNASLIQQYLESE